MNNLRIWRKGHGITLVEMATRLGISDGSLSRIERNEQWPDREIIKRIVSETGGEVTANDLLGVVVPVPTGNVA